MKPARCYKILFLGLLTLVLLNCEPDKECRQTANVNCKVVFACDTMGADSAMIRFKTIDSLSVWGLGSDSVLYDNRKNVTSLLLPLRGDTTITKFLMVLHGSTDTITVYHQNTNTFISLACGCFIYHTIDTVLCSSALLDSVQILNTAVENYEQDNVRLYFTFPNTPVATE